MSVYKPTLAAEVISDQFKKTLNLNLVTKSYDDLCPDIKECGASVVFPVVNNFTAASTFGFGASESLAFEAVSTTDTTANILTVAKGVTATDKDLYQSKGDIRGEILNGIGYSLGLQLNEAIASEICTNATHTDSVAVASFNNSAVYSLFDAFGAQISGETFAGLVIDSHIYPYFRDLTCFTDKTKTYNNVPNGIVDNQAITGYLNGNIPVIICDSSATWNSTSGTGKMFLIKKGACGLLTQRGVEFEQERKLDTLSWRFAGTSYYACKLFFPGQVSLLSVTGLGE